MNVVLPAILIDAVQPGDSRGFAARQLAERAARACLARVVPREPKTSMDAGGWCFSCAKPWAPHSALERNPFLPSHLSAARGKRRSCHLNDAIDSRQRDSPERSARRLTFDMRGAQKAQPFGHPLDGRVRRRDGRHGARMIASGVGLRHCRYEAQPAERHKTSVTLTNI